MSAGMINGASRERIGKAVPTGEELKGAVAIGKDRIRYIVGWIHPDVQPPSLPELFDAGGCIGYGESSKEVGAFQHGPPDIKHHGWFAGAVLVALHCFRCNEMLPTLPIAHTGGSNAPGDQSRSIRKAIDSPNLMVMLDIVKGE